MGNRPVARGMSRGMFLAVSGSKSIRFLSSALVLLVGGWF